ncbi:hypothetical protein MFIFM68171_00076 [Madurella fahalii]|uniref:Transmembrane protein n=1 Tax=Madurella fahalii TaxID=1157608 RepID=A0ABQ0FWI6_9PEZI
MALEYLFNWAPFRVDALGLVTMLGAAEVDVSLGRLVENPWTEFLPLLGAFVIAGNQFVRPVPGVVLYSISDGIVATDVSGWLARWLNKQELAWNTNTYVWGVRQLPRRVWRHRILPLATGVLLNGGLVALSILLGDWFGFTNSVALTASVVVRWYMLEQNRSFLDSAVQDSTEHRQEFVKAFCLLADGRAISLHAPRGLITKGFLTTPRPYNAFAYRLSRGVAWLSFGVHVISIGQATLFIQIMTVLIMVSATIVCIFGVGSNEYQIGRRISVYQVDTRDVQDRRTVAYARLRLTEVEEASMLSWGLFPQKSNERWWRNYQQLKEEMALKQEPKLAVAAPSLQHD